MRGFFGKFWSTKRRIGQREAFGPKRLESRTLLLFYWYLLAVKYYLYILNPWLTVLAKRGILDSEESNNHDNGLLSTLRDQLVAIQHENLRTLLVLVVITLLTVDRLQGK